MKREFYLPLDFPKNISDDEIVACFHPREDAISDEIRLLELISERGENRHLVTFIGDVCDLLHDKTHDFWGGIARLHTESISSDPLEARWGRGHLEDQYAILIELAIFGGL